MYDEEELKKKFRLSKRVVFKLTNILNSNLVSPTKQNCAIYPLVQVLIALRFYATGTFQSVLGDLFNVTQPTVSRIVKKVTKEIAQLSRDIIKMPETVEDVRKIKSGFYDLYINIKYKN
jgi:nuclease HARBI1